MLKIDLILITLLCCSFLYVTVYGFIVWRKINKSLKDKEDAAIKALCDDYNEGLKRREHEICVNKERPEINLNR